MKCNYNQKLLYCYACKDSGEIARWNSVNKSFVRKFIPCLLKNNKRHVYNIFKYQYESIDTDPFCGWESRTLIKWEPKRNES